MQGRAALREYVESLIVSLLIAIVLRTFVIAPYKIPTGSMIPSLKIGDCIFAYKLPFGLKIPFTSVGLVKPKMPVRGDVIVFKDPDDDLTSIIKRVVGIPGDKIEIHQKRLFINDQVVKYEPVATDELGDMPAKELYLVEREELDGKKHLVMFRRGNELDDYGPVVVPSGHLFVLGDNRDSSADSRFWGTVPLNKVEGRAFFIWGSFNWDKKLSSPHSPVTLPSIRWERVFTFIQ